MHGYWFVLKAACALQSLAAMLRAAGRSDLIEPYVHREQHIVRTIEQSAWQGNHYAITISPSHPTGWNDPWALTTNGIFYDLLTAQAVPLMPGRVRSDLMSQINAYTRWPSMGIWRDMIGCYYGIYPQMAYEFHQDFFGDMYPRSFDSIGLLQAWAGIGIDVPDHCITISRQAKGWFPVPELADWKAGKLPWVRVSRGQIEIRNRSLLKGLKVQFGDVSGNAPAR